MYSLLKGNEPAPQRSDHVMFIRCLHVFFFLYWHSVSWGICDQASPPPLPLPHLPVSVAIYYSMFRINVGLHMKHLYVPTAHPAFALLLDAFFRALELEIRIESLQTVCAAILLLPPIVRVKGCMSPTRTGRAPRWWGYSPQARWVSVPGAPGQLQR